MTAINLQTAQPHTYQALQSFSAAVEHGARDLGLDPLLVELVKIRASQLNGCAYCLRTHTRKALEAGETTDRLSQVAAWWESGYFTETERAALGLTERVTDMTGTAPRHLVDVDVDLVLDREQFAAIAWLVIAINAWNRIAVTSHYLVAPPRAEKPSTKEN